MPEEARQIIEEYMEKYHDLYRFEMLSAEEEKFAKRRYRIKKMPTTDVAVRLLNAGIGDVIRDKLFSFYYIVSTPQSAERCQIAHDITKDILREQCKTEDEKCKIAKEISDDIISKECEIPHSSIQYIEISREEAIEIARAKEPHYNLTEITTRKNEHYITQKPNIENCFVGFNIFFMRSERTYYKPKEGTSNYITLSSGYVEKIESFTDHIIPIKGYS